MQDTLELLCSHRSERDYADQPVSDDMLERIVEAAHRAPTSINAQHVSIIVVRDASRRRRIAEIAGGQPWIARAPVFITVVIDFNKTRLGVEAAGKEQVIHQSFEGFAAAAVDAGIALESIMVAARALGLGVVPIGGIRKDSQAMIELLELPPLTFPIVGVAIGHVNRGATVKPRLDRRTFRHDERYDASSMPEAITAYDQALAEYWRQAGRTNGMSWSQNTASHYAGDRGRDTLGVAVRQGLLTEK